MDFRLRINLYYSSCLFYRNIPFHLHEIRLVREKRWITVYRMRRKRCQVFSQIEASSSSRFSRSKKTKPDCILSRETDGIVYKANVENELTGLRYEISCARKVSIPKKGKGKGASWPMHSLCYHRDSIVIISRLFSPRRYSNKIYPFHIGSTDLDY